MKKLAISIAAIMMLNLVAFADINLENINARHIELIKYHGDLKFLEGTHTFQKLMDTVASVFQIENTFNVYANTAKGEVYVILTMLKNDDTYSMKWLLKLSSDGRSVKTIGFTESYVLTRTGLSYKIELDQDASAGSRVDWNCLLNCVITCGGGGASCATCIVGCWGTWIGCVLCVGPCWNAVDCIIDNCGKCF